MRPNAALSLGASPLRSTPLDRAILTLAKVLTGWCLAGLAAAGPLLGAETDRAKPSSTGSIRLKSGQGNLPEVRVVTSSQVNEDAGQPAVLCGLRQREQRRLGNRNERTLLDRWPRQLPDGHPATRFNHSGRGRDLPDASEHGHHDPAAQAGRFGDSTFLIERAKPVERPTLIDPAPMKPQRPDPNGYDPRGIAKTP